MCKFAVASHHLGAAELKLMEKAMIFHKIWNNKDIESMSFEHYSQSGSSIGGEVEVFPKIYFNDGKVVEDIRVGIETYTTWAYENPMFEQGETVANCVKRHNKSIEDIEKIVVSTIDTTGENEIHEEFLWTPNEGWKKISYAEVYY
jgi:hypothetical protein